MAWTDRDVLLVLYRSTFGACWTNNTNWDTYADLGTWFGVEVNEEGRVVKLFLGSNNLKGIQPFPSHPTMMLTSPRISWPQNCHFLYARSSAAIFPH